MPLFLAYVSESKYGKRSLNQIVVKRNCKLSLALGSMEIRIILLICFWIKTLNDYIFNDSLNLSISQVCYIYHNFYHRHENNFTYPFL